MTKQSLRQQYIDSIMKNKYGDDEEKYYDNNLAFLETLSLNELANMVENNVEEEQDFEGEVRDIDLEE